MDISGLIEDGHGKNVKDYYKYSQGRFMRSIAIQVKLFFLCIVGLIALSYMATVDSPVSLLPRLSGSISSTKDALDDSLESVSMKNKTLMLTTINKQYAANNSTLDLFLESLRHGKGTQYLIQHLLVGALDDVAFDQCQARGLHCYKIVTEGVDFSSQKLYMSEDYLKMQWRRVLFFSEVLARGYSFLSFDADMVWFRDPFTQLNSEDDVQMSCDGYEGKPYDHHANRISTGFYFVRSNNRTVELYKRWYASRKIFTYMHDQDVLEILRRNLLFYQLRLKVRYLDTVYFSGFCQRSKDLRRVITLHANCCRSIKAKILDLRAHLDAWRTFVASNTHTVSNGSWPRIPSNCVAAWDKHDFNAD